MAYVTHDYDVAVGTQGKGALARFFGRIGAALARARQREAERAYLSQHMDSITRDTGIDRTALGKEVNKPFWKR